MATLRSALQEFFSAIGRPHTGAAFIHTYAASDTTMSARLDEPCDESIRAVDVAHALADMPLGRAITANECTDVATAGASRIPALSDNAVAWLTRGDFTAVSRVADLFAHAFLKRTGDTDESSQRLQRAFDTLDADWISDCAGLARVARLLAAQQQSRVVVAQHLAEAALLVVPQPVWHAVHEEFGSASLEWSALESAFVALRLRIAAADPYAHDRLLSVFLFPRDRLLPLPESGLISDVRLAGAHIGFAWPGVRADPSAGPLVASPLAVDDVALLTHVLLPGLAHNGLTIPWRAPVVRGAPLHVAVGKTPTEGSWREVLGRVIARYGLAAPIEAAGYDVEQVLDFACGAPTSAPAAGVVAPAAGLLAPRTAAVSTDATGAALAIHDRAGTPVVTRTYQEILASLRAQGIRGHDGALRELAMLLDDRLTEHGAPRILLIGPSGSGKSSILAALATATGRPYVRVDASSIVEHGWSGLTLADVGSMILHAAGGDVARAERSLVCLDEFCKAAAWAPLPGADGEFDGHGQHQHTASVRAARQSALLALLDNGPSTITCLPAPGQPPVQLRTRHMVVVAAGVFRGLATAGMTPSDTELEQVGIIGELVARLTARIVLAPLDAGQLEQLLADGPDAVRPAEAMCRGLGFELVMAPEALRLVARATVARHGGVTPRTAVGMVQAAVRRALMDALEEVSRADRRLRIGPDEILGELARFGG